MEIPRIDILCRLADEFPFEKVADARAEQMRAVPISHESVQFLSNLRAGNTFF
jgi:hypothetical protein